MIRYGKGGANTNKTGLKFEKDSNLKSLFLKLEYFCEKTNFERIYKVCDKYKNHQGYFGEGINKKFYYFLNYYLSTKLNTSINIIEKVGNLLYPDKFFFNEKNNVLYIIECKTQTVKGSTDEKIQTGPYKKYFYEKIISEYGINVEIMYIWNQWFNKTKYDTVKEFLQKNNIRYYLNAIPLEDLGIELN